MSRMSLNNVSRGRVRSPLSVLLYGVEGVGKSSWGADAPAPIFLDLEDGTEELDVARFPRPESWSDVLAALDALAREQHQYQTVVIDTLDALERLIQREVCRSGGKQSIEDFGYGKGYVAASELAAVFVQRLEALRRKGMHVVCLAHAQIRAFSDPAGDSYDKYRIKGHDKFVALFKEWAKAVLFANYRVYTVSKDGKTKALGDGARVVYTEPRPAWEAKNRYGLPTELPLNWHEFERSARAGEEALPRLVATVEELLARAPAELAERGRGALERSGQDPAKLARLADWLRNKLAQEAA